MMVLMVMMMVESYEKYGVLRMMGLERRECGCFFQTGLGRSGKRKGEVFLGKSEMRGL